MFDYQKSCLWEASLCLLFTLALNGGCNNDSPPAPPPSIGGITSRIDEGTFWHDIYFFNNGEIELHEVKVEVELIGSSGHSLSEKRYFAVWTKGAAQKVSVSIGTPLQTVQKYTIKGSCNEGVIDAYWTPQAGK